jgi:hypothetical protein
MEADAGSAQEMLSQLDSEHKEYIGKRELLEKQRQFIDADSILAAAMMV